MTIKLDGTNGITNVNGTAAAPAETGTTSTNTGLSFGTNTVTVSTAGSARATFDASGNLGIGTTSPGALVDVYNATSAALRVQGDSTTNIQLARYTADALGPNFNIRKGRGTVASPLAVASGDLLGQILFQAYGGTSNRTIAAITAYVDTYTSDTDISSTLRFNTTPSGSITSQERMRIDTSGNVGIGTTTPTQKLDVTGSANVSGTVAMGSSFLRNRIINGAMQIDQRNGGASVTQTASGSLFSLDRWQIYGTVTSKFTAQQNAGSVTPPVGYKNYLGITSSSAYAVTAPDQFVTIQSIEGLNVSDLGWGTANAQTITISFWVRSSLTGFFGGAVLNSSFVRSYPFGFTINVANTWEQKTVTIAGDTSGTWLTDSSAGLRLYFNLGGGSTVLGTVNTWASATYIGPTGSTSVVGTSGATWYLTGVQLEVGTVATPFERRLYGQELALCQRYYQLINSVYATAYLAFAAGNNLQTTISLLVTMRTTPIASASGWSLQNVPAPTITTTINTAVFDAVSTAAGNCFYRTTTPTTFSAEL